ncbi:unnamed protein product [Blepharisma stoltei]|uniref:Uncharacterized protein n=1 Tax=Blepharisma stoltei TaxID=1481888 RepID=A0AAU9IMU8_9CILI|nr:unnamed protein product [Blepharisma stoltei]
MLRGVKAQYFEEQAVGKHIKSSKKRYTWKFTLEGQEVTVDLFASKYSGKRTIKVDGDIKFDGKKSGSLFSFPFHIGSHLVIVMEVDKAYDLKIDSISFLTLYRESTSLSMKNYESWEAEDISPSPSNAYRDRSETWAGGYAPPVRQTSIEELHIEDWEKYAKPYKISQREIYQTAMREKLPIKPHPKNDLVMRDSMKNPFEFAEDIDSRYVFRPKADSESFVNGPKDLADESNHNDRQSYRASEFNTYNPGRRAAGSYML